MATPLGYIPPSPADDRAQAELDDLIAALHESGLLRALAGGARAYPDLLRPLLRALDADTLRSVLALGGALTHLDPQTSDRLATGLREARTAASEAARRPPEGPLRLLRRLRHPRTRQGLSAALAALAAVGGALHGEASRPDAPSRSSSGH